jgi:hypothetical protein
MNRDYDFYLPLPKNLDIKHDKPVNTRFRPNADNTLERMLKCAIGLALAKPEDIVLSCLNCDSFNEGLEICNKFNARPPARVIAFACEHHSNLEDEIPF